MHSIGAMTLTAATSADDPPAEALAALPVPEDVHISLKAPWATASSASDESTSPATAHNAPAGSDALDADTTAKSAVVNESVSHPVDLDDANASEASLGSETGAAAWN